MDSLLGAILDDPRLPFSINGALDAILRHIPYLSRSSRFVCLYRQILVEMSSYILILGGFIMSLLDDIHVILRHIPYSSRSLGVCAYDPYREDESCYDIFGIS